MHYLHEYMQLGIGNASHPRLHSIPAARSPVVAVVVVLAVGGQAGFAVPFGFAPKPDSASRRMNRSKMGRNSQMVLGVCSCG
jgi:hypothetical protein